MMGLAVHWVADLGVEVFGAVAIYPERLILLFFLVMTMTMYT